MFGDLTRVGANFHAMEAWSNLKKVNGGIGQIQSRLSTGLTINGLSLMPSVQVPLNASKILVL